MIINVRVSRGTLWDAFATRGDAIKPNAEQERSTQQPTLKNTFGSLFRMSDRDSGGAVSNYRVTATLWIAVAALLVLPVFVINNFLHQRYLLVVGSTAVVIILVVHAWLIHHGRYLLLLSLAGLAPALIVSLAFSVLQQGMIGVLWSFPAVIVFYFILPRRQAIFVNVCLLAVELPIVWHVMEPSLAVRVAATLFLVCAFAAIFVYVIEGQQQALMREEAQRRESMAGASHELRTPLAHLVAKIEAMRDGVRPLNQDQLTSLALSVDHLTKLVDDLYLLTLADASALVCNRQPERLDRIVSDTVAAAREELSEHDLRVETSLDSPVHVSGDAKHLRQIVDNLLGNCYRHATRGGRVSVNLKRQDGWAEMVVTDTGPGVSADALPRLFDRFYRVDRSRSREKGGTGLGLSLVKALAEAHGGEVGAFSAPEGGLGVRVRIPLLREGVTKQGGFDE